MDVRAIVVATDNITASMVRRALNSVGVTPDENVPVQDLMGRVRRQRYEAIVVDLTVDGTRELLTALRSEPSTRAAVLFALTNGKNSMREAFQLGATFVLEKPLALDRTLRCFRAAYGLIVGERRRYFRHRINVPVAIARSGGDPLAGMSIDVSTGGMLLQLATPVSEDALLKLQFSLPKVDDKIGAAAEVIWCKGGKVGVRFTRFTKGAKETLNDWLGQQIDKELGLTAPTVTDMKFPAVM